MSVEKNLMAKSSHIWLNKDFLWLKLSFSQKLSSSFVPFQQTRTLKGQLRRAEKEKESQVLKQEYVYSIL